MTMPGAEATTGDAAPGTMRLRVILPEDILLDERATRIVAEAENGSFGLLPRHADFVTALVPGIVAIILADGTERFVGTDEAILLKVAESVMISTRAAVWGDDLAALRAGIEERFRHLGERESAARSALARLEVGLARRFVELKG